MTKVNWLSKAFSLLVLVFLWAGCFPRPKTLAELVAENRIRIVELERRLRESEKRLVTTETQLRRLGGILILSKQFDHLIPEAEDVRREWLRLIRERREKIEAEDAELKRLKQEQDRREQEMREKARRAIDESQQRETGG